jgi:hypothetical protein
MTSIALMFFGMILGIAVTDPADGGLYGVTVLYLITIGEILQWILRQFITVESLMVSG